MSLKKFARLRLGLWGICLLLCLAGSLFEGAFRCLFLAAASAVFAVTIILNGRYWKCPYCGTPIAGWWKGKNSVCAKCGKSWKEEWE